MIIKHLVSEDADSALVRKLESRGNEREYGEFDARLGEGENGVGIEIVLEFTVQMGNLCGLTRRETKNTMDVASCVYQSFGNHSTAIF